MKLWRLLAEYDAETQTYSACAGPTKASPYTPDFDARLLGVRPVVTRTAATTLTGHVQFKMTCTTFNPNSVEFGAQGSGLQTAPAEQPPVLEWPMEQNVKSGVPITIEGRCIGAADVTNSILIYGLFEA